MFEQWQGKNIQILQDYKTLEISKFIARDPGSDKNLLLIYCIHYVAWQREDIEISDFHLTNRNLIKTWDRQTPT